MGGGVGMGMGVGVGVGVSDSLSGYDTASFSGSGGACHVGCWERACGNAWALCRRRRLCQATGKQSRKTQSRSRQYKVHVAELAERLAGAEGKLRAAAAQQAAAGKEAAVQAKLLERWAAVAMCVVTQEDPYSCSSKRRSVAEQLVKQHCPLYGGVGSTMHAGPGS